MCMPTEMQEVPIFRLARNLWGVCARADYRRYHMESSSIHPHSLYVYYVYLSTTLIFLVSSNSTGSQVKITMKITRDIRNSTKIQHQRKDEILVNNTLDTPAINHSTAKIHLTAKAYNLQSTPRDTL